MANYKVDGIILSTKDFDEADKIVKIFTKEKGIITTIAKGIKKATSRKSSHVDILTYAKFFLAKGKSMDILLEVNPHDNLKEEIEAKDINYLFYFSEVIAKTQSEESYDAFYFNEIIEIRSFLKYSILHSILKLQIEVLKHLGVLPDLRKCTVTEKSLKDERYYDSSVIGYNINDGVSISDRIIKIQLFLTERNIEDISKITLTEADFKEIFNIQNNWIQLTIESKINSFRFINE